MKFIKPPKWDIQHLRQHLQFAVDLEFWTIPFYMSVMYSIDDRQSDAYQLIRTVVNQEMLHLQSACNISNAYGHSPTFAAPVYKGKTIPHLDFSQDNPEVIKKFEPYTAEIGPLDLEHANAMCLIEIPEDLTQDTINLKEDASEYGSIGEFYAALRYGATLLKDHIRGNVHQVDYFSAFYRNTPNLTVTENADPGLAQVNMLINLIVDQGEGADNSDRGQRVSQQQPIIPYQFQNTADDPWPEDDHFEKFLKIKEMFEKNEGLPPVFPVKPVSEYTKEDLELQKILLEHFTKLRATMVSLFGDRYAGPPKPNLQAFFPTMANVGAAIRNCWINGVTPKYS